MLISICLACQPASWKSPLRCHFLSQSHSQPHYLKRILFIFYAATLSYFSPAVLITSLRNFPKHGNIFIYYLLLSPTGMCITWWQGLYSVHCCIPVYQTLTCSSINAKGEYFVFASNLDINFSFSFAPQPPWALIVSVLLLKYMSMFSSSLYLHCYYSTPVYFHLIVLVKAP